MTLITARHSILGLVDEAIAAGASQRRACAAIGMSERTLQRWRGAPAVADCRTTRVQHPVNRLSEQERERILAVANSAEFGQVPPSQLGSRGSRIKRFKSGKETQAHPLCSRRANYGSDRVRLPDLTLSFLSFRVLGQRLQSQVPAHRVDCAANLSGDLPQA